MKNRTKKFLSITILSVLVFVLVCPLVIEEISSSFEDVDYSTPVGNAVDTLVEIGITKGKTETEFGTDELVTRQQMAAFIYRLMNDGASVEDGENLTPFIDLEDPTFFYMISWANQEGIIKGTSDILFDPAGPITLRDAYTMICRMLGYKDIEYPNGYIKIAEGELKLNKDLDSSLSYTDDLTRGSVALLLHNAYTEMTKK